ncbi:hypothetical protein KA005_25350, partial [bacterium]|nr:hypothetical protein [bacterium]
MKKLFVIHPFLFAILPILFLFAHNINQVRFSETLPSLIITVVISGFLLLLLRLIFTNTLKAGIMVSVFWVLFFSYGHVYEIIKHWVIGGIEVGQNEYLLPIYGTLLIGSAYFIYRTGKKLYNLSSILNVIAVSLVAISLINIGTYKFIHLKRYKTTYKADIDITTEVTRRQVTVYPDIYCIILDEYAGLNQIKKVYNYDNNKFSNRLIEKGFYVAKKSRTKIPTTPQTLVALLNMRFPKESENPYEMIRNNEVTQFLKSKGYKYIHFGSWWSATIRSQ